MSAPIEGLTKEQLLNVFQAKAGCMHTQGEANSAFLRLREYLTLDQRATLASAWGHHRDVGEGREELDDVCNELRLKWSGVS
jgi:hypothetical protein